MLGAVQVDTVAVFSTQNLAEMDAGIIQTIPQIVNTVMQGNGFKEPTWKPRDVVAVPGPEPGPPKDLMPELGPEGGGPQAPITTLGLKAG